MRRAARVLGDECSLLLLSQLAPGPRRFGELLGTAAGNTRLLSDRLRRLTRAGVLDRHPVAGPPRGVAYGLTPMGMDLLPALAALRTFGQRWLPDGCDPLHPPASAAATTAGAGSSDAVDAEAADRTSSRSRANLR